MEVKVTKFVVENDMGEFSGSIFELGQNAAQYTWNNCLEAVEDYRPYLNGVDCDDDIDPIGEGIILGNIKAHFREYGAWSQEEIDEWTDKECYALFLQDVAAAARELEGYDTVGEVKEAQESGALSGRLYVSFPDNIDDDDTCDTDEVDFYFYLGL